MSNFACCYSFYLFWNLHNILWGLWICLFAKTCPRHCRHCCELATRHEQCTSLAWQLSRSLMILFSWIYPTAICPISKYSCLDYSRCIPSPFFNFLLFVLCFICQWQSLLIGDLHGTATEVLSPGRDSNWRRLSPSPESAKIVIWEGFSWWCKMLKTLSSHYG